ncbi:pep-cterm sorting domain-containing protein [Anaeramoeba ignava]|uniref:Pep-cterm sorting domain-containing protein n=1 Tax=Anaeramoeba ignava TaxID=1746090 RepID=A0A9Q0LRL6_ANAIG|nr:pep-cterm sorting domain-containing protein [Anaeramoeba ignava]KAJ5077281.1 pep-cterm sorting domain-containing protein [Anaeramoeba ignava]
MENVFNNQDKLVHDLKRLFLDPKNFNDFQIEIKNRNDLPSTIFYCHRGILSFRSEYFNALLRSKMKEYQEGKVIFNDISSQTMKNILEYIYTGKIEINEENALETLINSKKLCFEEELIKFISEYIIKLINIDNAVDILHISNQYDFENIYKYCIYFLTSNFQEIMMSNDFYNISETDLQILLENDNLSIRKEIELLHSIIKWAQFHCGFEIGLEHTSEKQSLQIKEKIKNLYSKIRFCDIPKKEFDKIKELNLIPEDISNYITEFHQFAHLPIQHKMNIYHLKEKTKRKKLLILEKRNIFRKSHIVGNNNSINNNKYIQYLKEWINDDNFFNSMELAFSARNDGFTTKSFHEKCDDHGKSLVLIKTTENSIIGGFTSIGFSSDKRNWSTDSESYAYIADEKAFLFTLRNSNKENYCKFSIRKNWIRYAVVYDLNRGPFFGFLGDLSVDETLIRGSTNLGYTYNLPPELKFGKKKQNNDGDEKFTGLVDKFEIEELEVYLLLQTIKEN